MTEAQRKGWGILAPIGELTLDTGERLIVYRETFGGSIIGLDESFVEQSDEHQTFFCPYDGFKMIIDEDLTGDFGKISPSFNKSDLETLFAQKEDLLDVLDLHEDDHQIDKRRCDSMQGIIDFIDKLKSNFDGN